MFSRWDKIKGARSTVQW